MNTARRAYALTEMLMMIAMIAVFMTLSAKPLRELISRLPRSVAVFQTQSMTANALKQIKQDVERSARILRLDEGVLTLEHDTGPVVYTLADGRILRHPAVQNDDDATEWELPKVKMQPRLWIRDNEPYALELTVWNRQESFGKKDAAQFMQTTVFFRKETPR